MIRSAIIHVLSIEDNAADALLIQEALGDATRLGWNLPEFDITGASRLQEGLDRLDAGDVDVVLTDLDLPDSRAEETFARIHAAAPDLPIVVLTGRDDEALARRTVRDGAEDYLFKREMNGSLLAHALIYAIERQQNKQALQASYALLEKRVETRTADLEAEIVERERVEAQRKAAIEALRESEETFRMLFNSTADAIFIHDLEGNFLEVNDEAVRRLGYTRQELLTMTPQDIDAPAYAHLVPQRIAELKKEGQALIETGHVTKSGKSIPVELSSRIIRYGGRPAILSVARDITQRKQIESERERALAALRESEERFREIYETSPIGIELYDADGRLTDINEAAMDIFGIADVAAVEGFDLFADPNVPEEAKARLLRGETVQYETIFDFKRVKRLNLYPTSRSAPIHLDVKITALGVRKARGLTGYLVQIQTIKQPSHTEEREGQ